MSHFTEESTEACRGQLTLTCPTPHGDSWELFQRGRAYGGSALGKAFVALVKKCACTQAVQKLWASRKVQWCTRAHPAIERGGWTVVRKDSQGPNKERAAADYCV